MSNFITKNPTKKIQKNKFTAKKVTESVTKFTLLSLILLLANPIDSRIAFKDAESCALNYKYCVECSTIVLPDHSVCLKCSKGKPMNPEAEEEAYQKSIRTYASSEFLYECQST
jgi:hypothetical protein